MFRAPSAEEKPTLAVEGYIDRIGEPRQSSSLVYVIQPFTLVPASPSGQAVNGSLLYRPEWFSPNFVPDSLASAPGGSGQLFVYKKHIRSLDSLSTLDGLFVGASDILGEFARKVQEIPYDGSSAGITEFAETFYNLLRRAVESLPENHTVGYILRQRRVKETLPDGSRITVLDRFYDISEWFNPKDPKTLTRLARRANRNPEKFILALRDPASVAGTVPF